MYHSPQKLAEFTKKISIYNIYGKNEDITTKWKELAGDCAIRQYKIVCLSPIDMYAILPEIMRRLIISFLQYDKSITKEDILKAAIDYIEFQKNIKSYPVHQRFHTTYPDNVYSKLFAKALEQNNGLCLTYSFYLESIPKMDDKRIVLFPISIDDESCKKCFGEFQFDRLIDTDDFIKNCLLFDIIFDESNTNIWNEFIGDIKK